MNKEKKSEFTLRISQANPTELIIILYEIAIEYVSGAITANDNGDTATVKSECRNASNCIEEMLNNLHYEYELAGNLKAIYLYMKKVLRNAIISNETEGLQTVVKELTVLRDAYDQIKDTDQSGPVMVHTQAVLTGMTYGRNSVLDDLTTEMPGRGYRV